jgi:hypothetical protein
LPPERARSRRATRGSSLATIQRAMAGAIMRPLRPEDGMRPDAEEAAAALIKPNDRLTAFARLEIYNQQYWWRLLGNFRDDFPGLAAVLGDRRCDQLAVAYLDAHGSTSWNLRDLGQHLPEFIRSHSALTTPLTQLALEMAMVEWARVVAFDGPALPPIDANALAAHPPDQLRLRLQPHITLLELTFPIDRLLAQLKNSSADASTASNAVSGAHVARRRRLFARPARKPIYLAVHRLDCSVYYKRLEREAFRLLTALQQGENVGSACELAFFDAAARHEKAAALVQNWFATWMRFGWLCGAG